MVVFLFSTSTCVCIVGVQHSSQNVQNYALVKYVLLITSSCDIVWHLPHNYDSFFKKIERHDVGVHFHYIDQLHLILQIEVDSGRFRKTCTNVCCTFSDATLLKSIFSFQLQMTGVQMFSS